MVPRRQLRNAIPPLSGPSALRGSAEWQWPHTATLRTMYSPRCTSPVVSPMVEAERPGSGTCPPPQEARSAIPIVPHPEARTTRRILEVVLFIVPSG
jgi:hypothetical protein